MKTRSALVGLLLLTHVAAAEEMSEAELLTRSARTIARSGRCSALAKVADRVRELDADYYASEFAPDPVIAACREGVDTRMVSVAISASDRVELQPPSAQPAQAVPPAEDACSDSTFIFEPSVWAGPGGKVDVRHLMGVGVSDCADKHGLAGHLAARLDLENLGAFLGGEAEVSYPIGDGARVGLAGSIAGGTASQLGAGVRLRATNVWVGVDVVHTSFDASRDVAMASGASSTALMVGAGLSGDAGKTFGLGEAYVIYGAARAFEAACYVASFLRI